VYATTGRGIAGADDEAPEGVRLELDPTKAISDPASIGLLCLVSTRTPLSSVAPALSLDAMGSALGVVMLLLPGPAFPLPAQAELGRQNEGVPVIALPFLAVKKTKMSEIWKIGLLKLTNAIGIHS